MAHTLEAHPNAKFDVEYRPFLLDPTLKCAQSVDKNEHLVQKFGETRFKNACKALSDRGAELGITFRWTGKLRQTISAHRISLFAYQKDPTLQDTFLAKLFEAYFEQARDAGDPEVLAELAEAAGVMSNAEAIELLKSDKLIMEVQALMLDAHRKGITGVPCTVINQKYAVSGAQKSEAYAEIFENLITRGDVLEAEDTPDTETALPANRVVSAYT